MSGTKAKVIMLGAGHGGSDAGATANGVQEKVPNLAVVLKTEKYLEDNFTGHKIVLVRDTDKYVSLPARRDMALRVNPDLYVSFHFDYSSNSNVGGFWTFLHDGPLYGETKEYRKTIHKSIAGYMQTIDVQDRGIRRHNHHITRMIPAPTVLIEYMFISNPREAQLSMNTQVQDQLAKHTAIGIARALKLPKKEQAEKKSHWVVAAKHSEYDAAVEAMAELKRMSPSIEPFVAYERKEPSPIFLVVARELDRLDHANALKNWLRDRGFAASIIPADPGAIVEDKPKPPEPAPPPPDKPEPEPPRKKPEVIRPIGVMIGERMTDHEAWLLKGLRGNKVGSLGRLYPILKDLGIKVTGHGDYVRIHLPVDFQTLREQSEEDK